MTSFIEQLLKIVVNKSYRIGPYSPYMTDTRAICDAIRIETQMSEKEVDEQLERLTAK